MTQAVGDLLIEKGIFSADELRAMLEAIDAKSPAAGARVVARAWTDDGYQARLLEDVNKAAAELGLDAGGIPIRADENHWRVPNSIFRPPCSCHKAPPIGPS